jgi:simple sugar transport system permease protein
MSAAAGGVTPPMRKPGFDRAAVVEALLPPLLALLIALVLGDLLILAFGQSPAMVYRLLIDGTWGNPYGLGQVLYKATTLSFTGLAVAVGLRAGLFNIGAESQLAAGAFAAAAFGGALVGAFAGFLKARFGAHEVIVTIMLNFVVLALLNWAVAAKLHEPETLHTPSIHAGGLARLAETFESLHGSAANWTALVAVLAAVAVAVLLFRTRFGYDLRAAGLQPDAAEAGGIKVNRVWIWAMALAGALAGLGGTNFVLGYKGYYEDGLAGGSGFMGIAVALVGRNHPLGVLLASLLFATLSQGGLAIHAAVPKQLVEVLQATVILALAASVPEVRRLVRSAVKPRRAAGKEGA